MHPNGIRAGLGRIRAHLGVWRIACFALLPTCVGTLLADRRIQLTVDTSEADAVLFLLARRAADEPVEGSDWERLFGSEPYRRLKRREATLKSGFEDAEFQSFVLSDALLKGARVENKSRIKRLRGLRQPQYRLRVDDVRVYYDVNDKQKRLEVLGFFLKPHAADWLRERGVPE